MELENTWLKWDFILKNQLQEKNSNEFLIIMHDFASFKIKIYDVKKELTTSIPNMNISKKGINWIEFSQNLFIPSSKIKVTPIVSKLLIL